MKLLLAMALSALLLACGGGDPEEDGRERAPSCTTYHDTDPPRKVCL